jgi:peptide/nickel transport system substrate-binding protein
LRGPELITPDRGRARRSPFGAVRWLALLVVLALAAAACGGTDEGGAAEGAAGAEAEPEGSGGTLRIAMSAGNIPQPTTPPSEGGEGLRFVGMTIYDGLTRFETEQGEELPTPLPGLAESWEISEDKMTWTFTLREGVTFHDGSPFNADAVIFQFNRMKDPDFEYYDALNAPKHAEQYRTFASWEKVDDYTVSITTTQPTAWLHWSLAQIMLPSPAVIMEYGNEDYAAHASGTGPFRMVNYVDGEIMELEANPDYYRGAPKLDGIVLYPQAEASSRTASLQTGEVDWAEVPAPDSLSSLEAEGFQIFMTDYPHAILIGYNQFREPLTDIRVRQALNYAADREGLATIISDTGVPAGQYVPEFHPAHAEGVGFSYDPELAEELLADAGFDDGELTLNLAYPINGSGNMYPNPMVEKLQQDFAAVGVTLELSPFEWGAFTEVSRAGLEAPENADYDLIWRSPGAGMLPNYFGRDWLCDRPGDLKHIFGYCNPDADALYNEAAATFDADASNALLAEMSSLIVDDAAALFWMHDQNLRVMSDRVHGYVHPRSWYVDYQNIWIEE